MEQPGEKREAKPITQLLLAAAQGDSSAHAELFRRVYPELKRLAAAQMRHERAGATLQTTMLADDAYLKLVGNAEIGWSGRAHFFSAAANAMRQICVDVARSRKRAKRGGGVRPAELDEANEPMANDAHFEDLVDAADLWEKLSAEHPLAAQVLDLKVFAGRTGDQVAELLGVSPSTVDAKLRLARAWLMQERNRGDTPTQ